MSDESAIVYVDGASRGNPGDAAFAYVIKEHGEAPVEHSEKMGKETNNVAEYTALVKALEKAKSLGLKKLTIHSDSELMVKQMNGIYRVKSPELQPLYEKAKDLVEDFSKVTLTHVRREENKRADELCNIALDGGKIAKGAGPKPPKAPSQFVGDSRVRDDVLECLKSARACWAKGDHVPTVELLWDQIWSILEEGGVLKKVK